MRFITALLLVTAIVVPASAVERTVERQAIQILRAGATDAERRNALDVLSRMDRISADAIETVAGTSRTDLSLAVRVAAVNTLTAWMRDDSGLVEQVSRELVETIRASSHPDLRGLAIQSLALEESALPHDVIVAMAERVQADPVAQNRAIAALALGRATAKSAEFATLQLANAYERETTVEVKRNLLMQIVRAAKTGAPEVLRRLSTPDPLLQADVTDYLDILAQGITEGDAVWAEKFRRDSERGTFLGFDHTHVD